MCPWPPADSTLLPTHRTLCNVLQTLTDPPGATVRVQPGFALHVVEAGTSPPPPLPRRSAPFRCLCVSFSVCLCCQPRHAEAGGSLLELLHPDGAVGAS